MTPVSVRSDCLDSMSRTWSNIRIDKTLQDAKGPATELGRGHLQRVQRPRQKKVIRDSAYSKASSGRVQAAYRAPDAPGLVRAGSGDAPTTLFTAFSVAMHTVLLFGGDEGARAEVLDRLPKEAVRAVRLLPQGQTAGDAATSALVLEDRDGHAYAGYGLSRLL
ncbi:hypothetical protein K438DRAFT_2022056 [Mycena galopus ATCC 62051]|nr:hypothetical protein K438DRAFT_2022056 [Mycena galopus ATCC 62051]